MKMETAQNFDRWIRRGIYLIFAIPLLPAPPVLFPAVFGRALWFFAIVSVVAILALIRRSLREAPKEPPAMVSKWLVAYVVLMAVATMFSADRGLSFWGDQGRMDGLVIWLFAGVFFLLLRSFVATAAERNRALSVTIIIATTVSVFAILQWFFPFFRQLVGAPGERVSGTLGNPILLATYLALHLFLAGGRIASVTANRRRALWIAAAALIFIALALTQSKAGMLAAIAGVFVTLIVMLFAAKNWRLRTTALATLILVMGFSTWVLFRLPGTGVLPPSVRALTFRTATGTLETRLLNWQIAFQGLRDRPVFGAGPEAYRFVFAKHYRPELLRYSFTETVSDKPHNLFLEIAAETGILGLIVYLGMIAMAFIGLLRAARRAPWPSATSSAALVALMAALFFSFDAPMSVILLMLLLTIATPERPGTAPVVSHIAFPKVLAAAGLIVPLLAFGFVLRAVPASIETAAAVDAAAGREPSAWMQALKRAVVRPSVFERENLHHLARWLVVSEGRGSLPLLTLRESADILAPRLTAANPVGSPHFVLHMLSGQVFMIKGQLDHDAEYFIRATAAFDAAAALSPNHQSVAVARGRLFLLQGDAPAAAAVLKVAVDADPVLAEPHWYYGLALTASGDHSAGLAELEAARRLGRDFKSVRERTYFIDLLVEAGRLEDVAREYEALIAEQPEEAKWHAQLAATYARLGRPELAIAEAQRAIELDPSIRENARSFLKSFGIELP